MDWENDVLQDSIDDTMQEQNDLVAEAYSSIAELNLEIGNPGNAAVDYVNNELGNLELSDLSEETLQPMEVPDAPSELADVTKSANAADPNLETVPEGDEDTDEAERKILGQAIMEQPYNSSGSEKRFSPLRQTIKERDTAFEGSMTSFAIQRFLADMQNAEALASNALRKSDDTRNNILGKI